MEFFASIALGFTAFVNSVLGLPGEIVQSFKTDLTPPVQERTVDAQNDLAKIIETSAVPDGADPNTYVVLYEGEDGMYAKDKDSVYYSSELLGWVPKKVNGADPHTFTILYTPEGKLTHYGKDKDRTYLRIFEVYESGAEHGTDISFVSNNEQASAPISSSPPNNHRTTGV